MYNCSVRIYSLVGRGISVSEYILPSYGILLLLFLLRSDEAWVSSVNGLCVCAIQSLTLTFVKNPLHETNKK